MKKFFLNLLTSFMGAWLAIVLAGIVAVVIIIAMISGAMAGNLEQVSEGCILKVDLDGPIRERAGGSQMDLMSVVNGNFSNVQSVENLVNAIHTAAEDSRVSAIYLDCGAVSAAPASLNAIRESLLKFKSSGKKIYAYADAMTQGAYFVATVADSIYLNPAGNFDLHGLGGHSMFYKGLFDKIGVQFQAVRVGKGKAAVEPFTSDTMSTVARRQNMELIDTLWKQMRFDMCDAGLKAEAKLDSMVNNDYLMCKPASFALENKFVDGLAYRHEFEDKIAKLQGQKDGLEKVISPATLLPYEGTYSKDAGARNQIAVLYACGSIDDPMSGGGIDSQAIVDQVLEFAKDDNIKALVLRVNSPGGSAFGSEQMWEALETFKAAGKVFTVSMGDYAASGGYYISCGADCIFADRYTITGSIGIFGLIPNVKGLLDMAGLHVETVATNPQAIFPTGMKPLDEAQLAAMQSMVEDGYDLFVSRVAAGRKMTVEKVKEFADGRPISSAVAKRYGLVDNIGTLEAAIEWTRSEAKLKDANVVVYPELQVNFMDMLSMMQNSLYMKLLNVKDPVEASRSLLHVMNEQFGGGRIMTQMYPLNVTM